MKNKPYKRKPGDLEVRILSDGRVVMIAPDEKLLEVAQAIEPKRDGLLEAMETEENGGTSKNKCGQTK
jgi:hypothetical protein